MRPIPERPATSASQVSWVVRPTGVMAPRPVTTTSSGAAAFSVTGRYGSFESMVSRGSSVWDGVQEPVWDRVRDTTETPVAPPAVAPPETVPEVTPDQAQDRETR